MEMISGDHRRVKASWTGGGGLQSWLHRAREGERGFASRWEMGGSPRKVVAPPRAATPPPLTDQRAAVNVRWVLDLVFFDFVRRKKKERQEKGLPAFVSTLEWKGKDDRLPTHSLSISERSTCRGGLTCWLETFA